MKIKIVYFAYLKPEAWLPIVTEQLDALYNITNLYETSTIFMSVIDETDGQTQLKQLNILLSEKYSKIQLINIFSENVLNLLLLLLLPRMPLDSFFEL